MTFSNPIELNSTGQTCSLHFFTNVKNGLDIRKKLMSGQIDATIINAELIPDVLQIFVAANKASLNHSNVSFFVCFLKEIVLNQGNFKFT